MAEKIQSDQRIYLVEAEPDTHKLTLGRWPVIAHDKVADKVIKDLPLDSVSIEILNEIDDRIIHLHDKIQEAPDPEKAVFGEYTWESMPKFMRLNYLAQTGDSEEQPDYKKVADWMFIMNEPGREHDEKVINFFQAHNDRIQKRQSEPEFLMTVEKIKRTWKNAVIDGVQAGNFDISVIHRLEGLENTKIFEGDKFNTLLVEALGVHYPNTKEVVVAPKETGDTLMHELCHDKLAAPDLHKTPLDVEWINEALTEHSMQVIAGKTDVEKILTTAGTYQGFLILLDAIGQSIKSQGLPFQFSDLTRAYSMADPLKRQALLMVIGDRMRRSIHAINLGSPNDLKHPFSYISDAIDVEAQAISGLKPADQDYAEKDLAARNLAASLHQEMLMTIKRNSRLAAV